MELRQLASFLHIASLGSFNKAAEALNLAQSTISEQIKALEADLRVTLFRRDGRSSVLTPAGETLLRYAREMNDLEKQLRVELQDVGAVKGKLSIRMPETVSARFLPPALTEFALTYPFVELTVHSCAFVGVAEELRSGIINLAFLITESFRYPDLETRELGPVPLAIVSRPDHELAGEGPISLQCLESETFFAPTSDCDYFKILERMMAGNQLRFSSLIRMTSLEGIRSNVREGNGMAILTRASVEDDLLAGRMVEIPLETGPLEASLIMIWLKNRWQAPALKAFMAQFEKTFAERFAP